MINKIKPNQPEILVCNCSSREHQLVFEYDDDDNELYCHIHLTKESFLSRLKLGMKYIFGYKSKYGEWDEFIFKPEHSDTLLQMSKLLKNK